MGQPTGTATENCAGAIVTNMVRQLNEEPVSTVVDVVLVGERWQQRVLVHAAVLVLLDGNYFVN